MFSLPVPEDQDDASSCPHLLDTVSVVAELGLEGLGHALGAVGALVRGLDAAGRDPQEVVGAEVVDLVEEEVESAGASVRGN